MIEVVQMEDYGMSFAASVAVRPQRASELAWPGSLVRGETCAVHAARSSSWVKRFHAYAARRCADVLYRTRSSADDSASGAQ